MAEKHDPGSTPLGIYRQPKRPRITGIEVVAILLTVVWLGLVLAFFGVLGGTVTRDTLSSAQFLMPLLAFFVPVAMIWVAAMAVRIGRTTREESRRLQASVDALRKAYITQSHGTVSASEPLVSKKLDEIAAAQRKTETALTMFTSIRAAEAKHSATRPQPVGTAQEDQPALALGTRAEDMAPLLSNAELIRALNFPETAEDEEGFNALRHAMRDRQTAQLIRAAQDSLTLLSQDGIYMDDLRPDMARPEIWRRFAAGERGRSVAALGGVRDRSSLVLASGRMKQDPIFRDAAHHFLRLFDRSFTGFEKDATDADISGLSDTRTARAFMLLGRVAGTFD